MAILTFKTPNGNECYGCMALNNHSFYCEFFKEFLHNEYGGAGCMKCDKCKSLDEVDSKEVTDYVGEYLMKHGGRI